MDVGIVGLGVVGGAVKYGLEKLGHDVVVHDIKMDTTIESVLHCEICYVCVPTPSAEDGRCDVSIVDQVVGELKELGYDGIIAIKSTVEPGTTERLGLQYHTTKICFVPEFLRERCAIADFIENHDLCVIGTHSDEVFEAVKESHGKYPTKFVKLGPTEAEFVKYMNNVYNATLITLANSFYELCKLYKADYSKVKAAIVQRRHIYDMYLDCNEIFRGFGGPCLPKDLKALAHVAESNGTDVKFFDDILKENCKYKTTCFDGMRV
jgi:UDPglucose 6-dehydrogenase